jgi:hypothetical protein
MSKSTQAPAGNGRSSLSGSAGIDAMVARTAPAVLALLADGVARSRAAIVAALADRQPSEDVIRTLLRLAVTGRVLESGHKYRLPAAPGQGVEQE